MKLCNECKKLIYAYKIISDKKLQTICEGCKKEKECEDIFVLSKKDVRKINLLKDEG